MPFSLDHVVVAVRDLEQAIGDYRDLGFTVLPGGAHANGATHNALICFEDGSYIELLARTGASPRPGPIDFSPLLDNGEGLVGYALRTDDLEAAAARLRMSGVHIGDIVSGERRRGDGTLVRWRMLPIEGGFAPFLIQDITPHHLRVPNDPDAMTHANRAVGLRGVEIAVRDMKASTARYAQILGLEPRSISLNQIALKAGRIVLFQPNQELLNVDWGAQVRDLGATEVLYAVELLQDRAADDRFRLEATHGIRIEQRAGD